MGYELYDRRRSIRYAPKHRRRPRADDRCHSTRRNKMYSFELAVVIGAVFLLAGFVKGVVGLGLPTITMGLLSLAMPPAQAAALLVVPSLITNVWQLAARPGLVALTRRIASLLAGVCAGVALGAGWLTGGPSQAVGAALGLALMAYASLGLLKVRLRVAPRHE